MLREKEKKARTPEKPAPRPIEKNGHGLNGYRPTEKEPFMNERQREYFRAKLLIWKDEILKEARDTLQHLQDENQNHPDLADRASSETDRAIELRARDRQRKLISKIDAALARIDDGTYGYCEETGEPISLKRLEARPIATLSIEAQERHERRERVYRDDRDVRVDIFEFAQTAGLRPGRFVFLAREIHAACGRSLSQQPPWLRGK